MAAVGWLMGHLVAFEVGEERRARDGVRTNVERHLVSSDSLQSCQAHWMCMSPRSQEESQSLGLSNAACSLCAISSAVALPAAGARKAFTLPSEELQS